MTTRAEYDVAIVGIGHAAMACDPLRGVGCGFALQSAEWLVDCTADAATAGRGLDAALTRYRRRHRRGFAGHHFLMNDFASGRPFNPIERMIYAAAARDEDMTRHLYDYASRQISAQRFLSPAALARAAWVNLRHDRQDSLVAGHDAALAA